MFLKLAYLSSKLRFSGQYLFQELQISAGQLLADSSTTETLNCLTSCVTPLKKELVNRINNKIKVSKSVADIFIQRYTTLKLVLSMEREFH